MPPSKDVRDHWQAGVALVYGEIGELLTRVERLREDMPNVVEAGTRNLNTSIIAIVKATKGAQAVIDGYGAAQEKRLAELGAHERQQLEATVRQLLDDLKGAAGEHAQARPSTRSIWWRTALVAIAFFVASAGGAYLGASLAR